MSGWTDPGRLLNLPPVAMLALHFVLVDLPARLSTPTTSSVSSHRHGSPSGISDGEGRKGSTATASPGASPGKGEGTSAGSSGVGSFDGGVGDGVGGVGGGGAGQLGDVPSYVFRVVLPSDPAFDAEVRVGDGAPARWFRCFVAKAWQRLGISRAEQSRTAPT